jgi:hypothetical protein
VHQVLPLSGIAPGLLAHLRSAGPAANRI